MDSNAAKTIRDMATLAEYLGRSWHALAYAGPQGSNWRPGGAIRPPHDVQDWAECVACAPDREAISAARGFVPMEEPPQYAIVRWWVGGEPSFAVRMDTDTDSWRRPGIDDWFTWGQIMAKAGGRPEVIWLPSYPLQPAPEGV